MIVVFDFNLCDGGKFVWIVIVSGFVILFNFIKWFIKDLRWLGVLYNILL